MRLSAGRTRRCWARGRLRHGPRRQRSGVTLADAATEHGMAALDNELASERLVGDDVSSRTLTGVSDVADDAQKSPSGSRTARHWKVGRASAAAVGGPPHGERAAGSVVSSSSAAYGRPGPVDDDAGTSVDVRPVRGFPSSRTRRARTAVLGHSAVDGPAASSSGDSACNVALWHGCR